MKRNFVLLVVTALMFALSVQAHATTYTDKSAFMSAVSGFSISTDDFASYPLGNISNGQTLGDFTYTFDPTTTQPGVASDGGSGQALGDTTLGTDPNFATGVFVGGESVTLTHNGGQLLAFGADFSYAPNFEPLPANLYELDIVDGAEAGTTVGNPAGLDANGGTFFLGFIADSFTQVSLLSLTPLDADGNPYLTPAYQVDDIIYGPSRPVPEPGTLLMVSAGLLVLIPIARNNSRRTNT